MKLVAVLGTSALLVSTGLAATLDWGPNDANWTDPGVWYNTATAAAATFSPGDSVTLEDTRSGTGDRTITVTSSVLPGSVTCSADSKNFTLTGSGGVGGTNGLAKSGAGALTLGLASSYSGGTTVNGGQLNLDYGASSDTTHSAIGTGAFTIAGACTLDNTSAGSVTIGPLLPLIWNADFTFIGTHSLAFRSGSGVTLGGDRMLNIQAANAGTFLTVNGAITGAYSLTKTGNGWLALVGANTFVGMTLNAGKLTMNNAQALGSTTGAFTIAGGTIDSSSSGGTTLLSYTQAWNGDFAFDGHASLNLGAGPVTLGGSRQVTVNTNTLTVGGAIGDGGHGFGLTLAGAGELRLNGTNTYTGATTVNGGTLRINGSTSAASAVTVASGGILGGTGALGGPVTVAPGGTLTAGAAFVVGTLSINNSLTLAGDLYIEVNKLASPASDAVAVSGNLTNAGTGTLTVANLGPALAPGDSFQIFNKPLPNGAALQVVSSGSESWTNRLAIDGSIAVASATNPPVSGDPTKVFIWTGTSSDPTNKYWNVGANWVGNVAPPPLSSNIYVFQGDYHPVPDNWPYLTNSYGTSILIFSNTITSSDLSIKMLAGWHNTMNFGSYVRQDSPKPMYWGCTGPVPVKTWWVTNGFFTNALGDASVGSQTDFQCTGGRLDLYGVLRDAAGTHSKLVKSGPYTLNLTGDVNLGNDANSYTGGTVVNAGPIKLAKLPGVDAIPGDVIVNGSGALAENVVGGEQIADTAIVTFNDSAQFDMASQPETVQTIQSASASASVINVGTLTVAPSSSVTYSNGGGGESDFSGSISGSGSVAMNGTGTYGMLGVNAVGSLTVNSGTLKVNGNSGTGPVTVNTGATLLGRGTMAGAVTVASGGTIGAGFGVGQLTLGAGLDLSAGGNGATNLWELAANSTSNAGTDFDQIVASGGALALGARATLDLRFIGSATAPDAGTPFWQSAHTWTVIAMGGGANPGNSNFGRIRNGSYPAGNFTTSVDGSGNVLLSFTPSVVTEPTPPRITGISNTAPSRMTVSYTNTLPGTNYTLVYNTNLSTNWYPIGAKQAVGSSDSQTDSSATNNQRFYRVYYP